jgi:hypothetical protein
MKNKVTRNNHYVPEWYQRGFLGVDQFQLHLLDATPDQKLLADGRIVTMNAVRARGPSSCFVEFDLYSTHFGTHINDEVERLLFGSIDTQGAKAVRAFAGGDPGEMHRSFEDFFEYMDAQKLRTPKGLDWIKAVYPSLSQMELMREMQGLRLMHCTMWTEGVREIVSAEDSNVKFIISDHPVTTYHSEFPPSSNQCRYPSDPAIDLIGTQTIFALDANTCLILTNLEYAQNPDTASLTAARTFARSRGPSYVRTDAFIRTRKLTRDEVVGINYLIKSRARRHIAASERDWLYPEKEYVGGWAGVATILLPRRDDLWRFGGETYVGFKDGSSHYQDAFGRTSRSHEYLRRKSPAVNRQPNDDCGCGSGRKYKKCCKNLPQAERPSWEVYGIRERNLMFAHHVEEILGLKEGKVWGDVQRELSDDQVKRIYEAFSTLWPEDTDLTELLPRPEKGTLRMVFLGISDPRTIEASVLGWTPYFDEIVLAHPFVNPIGMRPEFSPTHVPSHYKSQTLKNVLLLLALRPYIDAGIVHLVPDPGDFNSQFGQTVLNMAQARAENWTPDRKSFGILEKLAKDDEWRLLMQLPATSLRKMVGDSMPGQTEEELSAAIHHMRSKLSGDPFALLQEQPVGEAGSQFIYLKGYNLESALFLAALTGSLVYTDTEAHWQQLHEHALRGVGNNASWDQIQKSLSRIRFLIEVDDRENFQRRASGRFGNIRAIMRKLAEASKPGSITEPHLIASKLDTAANQLELEWERESARLRLTGTVKMSVPSGGFTRNEVQRLLVTFGRIQDVRPLSCALFIDLKTQGS